MEQEEQGWLEEMLRLSGVPQEEDTDEPYIPGMLSFEEEDVRERERRQRLRAAEEQTLALIEEQEALAERKEK